MLTQTRVFTVYSPFPFPSSAPPPHLCGSPVLPARGDMSDDAGVALLADIDAVHLDDALARVEAGDGCHCAWCETRGEQVSRATTAACYRAGER